MRLDAIFDVLKRPNPSCQIARPALRQIPALEDPTEKVFIS